eukprot:1524117-Amphidinium_carterae.1
MWPPQSVTCFLFTETNVVVGLAARGCQFHVFVRLHHQVVNFLFCVTSANDNTLQTTSRSCRLFTTSFLCSDL